MKKKAAVWVVISMAHSEERAREIEEKLTQEGFMIQLRAVTGESDPSEQLYEVLALSSEAQEARSLLLDMGL